MSPFFYALTIGSSETQTHDFATAASTSGVKLGPRYGFYLLFVPPVAVGGGLAVGSLPDGEPLSIWSTSWEMRGFEVGVESCLTVVMSIFFEAGAGNTMFRWNGSCTAFLF